MMGTSGTLPGCSLEQRICAISIHITKYRIFKQNLCKTTGQVLWNKLNFILFVS